MVEYVNKISYRNIGAGHIILTKNGFVLICKYPDNIEA